MALLWDCTPNGIFTTASFTSGIRASMNGAEWSTVITPTNAFSSYSGFNALIANGNGGLWIVNSQIELYRDEDGGLMISSGTIVNTAGNPITITIKPATRQLVISGASGSGNGTYTWSAGTNTIFSTGSIGVGRYTDGGFTFAGTVADIQAPVSALNVDPSGIASAYASGTAHLSRTLGVTGIATAESFGTAQMQLGNEVFPSGIASLQAFGTAVLEVDANIDPSGIASLQAFGTASFVEPVPIEVGVHGKVVQLFGSGGSPARITLTTSPGSFLVMGRGGRLDDQATAPTDNKAGTWQIIGSPEEYTDWAAYGSTAWFLRNTEGGSSHQIDCNVTSFDEHTVTVVELLGDLLYVQDVAVKDVANASESSTHVSNPVTTTGPACLICHWWGANPVGDGDNVVSGTGWTVLEFFGTDDPNGYVQHYLLIKIVDTAGTYTATLNQTPAQGAITRLIAVQSATLLPGGILTAEIVGTTVILTNTYIDPSGAISTEAFGILSLGRQVVPSGIASIEAFGTDVIQYFVTPAGISSIEAFGTSATTFSVTPSGIVSVETFGSPSTLATVTATALTSGEAFGTLASLPETFVDTTGVQSAEVFGTAQSISGSDILLTGIASNEGFGTAIVPGAVAATGIASTQVFGTLSANQFLTTNAIVSLEAFGVLENLSGLNVLPTGITSLEAFGTGIFPSYILPTGIVSIEAFGTLRTRDLNVVDPVRRVMVKEDPIQVKVFPGVKIQVVEDPIRVGVTNMKIRQNSLSPVLETKAFKRGGYVDLTTYASIQFRMTDGTNLKQGAAVGDAEGNLTYTWATGDTDTLGTFRGIFVGLDGSGGEHLFPTEEDIIIEVIPFPSG